MPSGFGQKRAVVTVTLIFVISAKINNFDSSVSMFGRVQAFIPVHKIVLWGHELFNGVVGIPVFKFLDDDNNFGHMPSMLCLL